MEFKHHDKPPTVISEKTVNTVNSRREKADRLFSELLGNYVTDAQYRFWEDVSIGYMNINIDESMSANKIRQSNFVRDPEHLLRDQRYPDAAVLVLQDEAERVIKIASLSWPDTDSTSAFIWHSSYIEVDNLNEDGPVGERWMYYASDMSETTMIKRYAGDTLNEERPISNAEGIDQLSVWLDSPACKPITEDEVAQFFNNPS